MQKTLRGVIVAGVLVAAGAAVAQTPGSTVDPTPPRGIIPVTGPSMAPVLPELAKPDAVPVVAQGEAVSALGAPKSKAARPPAAKTSKSTSHAVKSGKAVHNPAGKATAKKAAAPKHVAKATGSAKTKHVAQVKHQPPARHAAVGKPIPVAKPQAPAKRATPAEPVLPRV
ncbi:MAG TPA: hypothetical protein VIE44_12710 [Methylomirabilota bacterium]